MDKVRQEYRDIKDIRDSCEKLQHQRIYPAMSTPKVICISIQNAHGRRDGR
jgi:hypothetical protein